MADKGSTSSKVAWALMSGAAGASCCYTRRPTMKLCAISVDLDEIPNYFQIHGLRVPEGKGSTAVYDIALDRLEDWSASEKLPLALFTIGADMARPENAKKLRLLGDKGHEIANHSLDHLYDLTRKSREEMRRQVESGIVVLEGATGHRPVGFRAPGYTMSDELMSVLDECGVEYDSSVFPCPPYYFAKAAAMTGMRLRGRKSRSILDKPDVLRAPTTPYRVGRPYWKKGGGMLELPIQVTPGVRFAYIGTFLMLAGIAGARLLTRQVAGQELVNLELHGIDVLDVEDGLAELKPHQPDVRIPTGRKLDTLSAVVEELRKAGYAFVRLDEAARVFA
jgi:peptidoglycan/xylan/chitin deacetylase (PgdA/CDA1 family)